MTTPPPGLMEAFWSYERALMGNDLQALDDLFERGEDTLRGDGDGLLVGHRAISEFRRGRGGAPTRTVGDVHVRVIDQDAALIVCLTHSERGQGLQTQLWRRSRENWLISAAHVTAPSQSPRSR